MSDKFVVRARGGQNVSIYHANPDECWCLPNEESRRYVDAEHVERRNLRPCRVCDGTREVATEQRTPLRTQIEQGEVEL